MILLKASFSVEVSNRPAALTALGELRRAALGIPGCRGFEILEEPYGRGALTVVEEWTNDEAMNTHEASEAVITFRHLTGALLVQQGPTQVIRLAPPQAVYVTLEPHEHAG